MDLRIGAKIIELRKAKGMTQEQLAAALGVSAPAVSKWETDSSYPDITLLCPLARALGTDVDALLAFEEDLPEESLGQYMKEIISTVREGKVSEAEKKLNALLHSYPSNIPLKFSATAAFSFFEMAVPEAGEEEKMRWTKQEKELAQAVYRDGNPAYYLSSIGMLVSLALAENELEQAESLLKQTLTNTADFTALWVQMYLKKGEQGQALETVQRQLYKLVSDMRTCLMSMMGEGMALDMNRTIEICKALQMLGEIFRVGGGTEAGMFAEVYLRAGKTEEALQYLESLAEKMTSQVEPPNPLLFAPAVAPGPEQLKWNREICMAILHGLEKDACFEELRGEERFQRLMRKIADGLEKQAETGDAEA